MDREIRTGGGAYVDGNASTGGGDFAGRDFARGKLEQTVVIARDALDDAKTDISLIKDDIRKINFSMFSLETKIEALKNTGPSWFQFIMIIVIILIVGIPFYLALGYVFLVALKV